MVLARWGILSLILMSVTACGWHLRGMGSSAPMPFKTAQVEDRGADAVLTQQLVDALAAAGVKLDEQAQVRVVLENTRWHISRTGYTLTGDVAAELLSLKQPFKVLYQGRLLLEDTAEVYRDHQIDTRALAAAESEKRSLMRQMRQEAALQIVRRLQHLSFDEAK